MTHTRPTSQDDVLCRFCGKAIRERTNKQGETVWTRTGQGGPMVICEGSPNHYWHDPYRDDPGHGHTFRIEVTSRGSYGVVGEEGHTDAEEFMGGPMTVDIRAWNLPDALRQAAAVFPAIWHLDATDHEHDWVGERHVKDAPDARVRRRCSICDATDPNDQEAE